MRVSELSEEKHQIGSSILPLATIFFSHGSPQGTGKMSGTLKAPLFQIRVIAESLASNVLLIARRRLSHCKEQWHPTTRRKSVRIETVRSVQECGGSRKLRPG